MDENKRELTYEEQVEREFNLTQEQDENPGIVKDLGRVDITRGTHSDGVQDDENVQRINNMIGYLNVPLETLPSKGRFYPENIRISIRAARVGEIREFSTIDENDAKDVADKMTYIVSQCCKVYYGNIPGHYKDLTVADRIVLIIKIRELTFVDGQSSIKIPVPAGACGTPGCKPQENINFTSAMFEFLEPDEELEKYYDPVGRCYNIQTKNYGVITLHIPTIGVWTAVSDYVRDELQNSKKIEATISEMLPFLIGDWRGLGSKAIFAKISEVSGWSSSKFNLVYRLIEKINVGIKFEITDKCENCGGEIKVPISFPDGYKSIFVQTISDFRDELL
jgi:hypothetical protein